MAFLLEGVDAGEAVGPGGVESGEFENGGQSEWLNEANFDFALFYPAVTAVFGFAGQKGSRGAGESVLCYRNADTVIGSFENTEKEI